MFKYTKEIILNSLVTEDGERVLADADMRKLIIKRGGEYKKDNIQKGKIYKTAGYAGVRSVATIECTGLISQVNKVYETGLYQLGIYLKMPNKYLGEYANANWQQFGRPVLVGFEVTATETTNGAALATKLAKLIKVAMEADTKIANVTVTGSKIKIELVDPYMHFNVFKLEKYDPTVCDSCLGEYVSRDITNKVTIVDGREPFATGGWIQENLRFPSYPNVRYAALNEDEYPVPGAIYTQYAFVYESPRPGFGGLSGVNQKVEAVTQHIYYVKNELVDTFEEKITEAFGNSVIVPYNSVTIPTTEGIVQVEANTTVALTPYVYPALTDYTVTATVSDETVATATVTANNVVNVAVKANATIGKMFNVTVSATGNDTYAPAIVPFVVI